MAQKLLLSLSALALLATCQRAPDAAAEVIRPPQAGQGPLAARVLLLRGAIRVVAENGFTFPARPGEPLLRADRLEVGAGGAFVVLALGNGYLVRLDEETALPLTEVVLLDAPPAAEEPRLQLERLLTPEELAGCERMAGWSANMAAADTVAPEAQLAKGDRVAQKGLRQPEEERSTREKKEEAGEVIPRKQAMDERRRAELSELLKEKEATLKLLSVEAAPAWLAADGLPEWLRALPADPTWLACLRQALAGLPAAVRPASVRVELKVQEGRVVAVRLGRGLPSPACLLPSGPGERPFPGKTGWVGFELRLR